eukprot:764119-Hanusia_phi.AAC.2
MSDWHPIVEDDVTSRVTFTSHNKLTGSATAVRYRIYSSARTCRGRVLYYGISLSRWSCQCSFTVTRSRVQTQTGLASSLLPG